MSPAPRTLVVGYDGSPAARAAVVPADDRVGPDGRVIVVHAYEVPAGYIGATYYVASMERAAETASDVMRHLEETCPELRTVAYETDVLAGPPADAICNVAKVRHADEIVLGTRGVGRVRGLMGSVAHDVIHRAPCPVVVIPEHTLAEAPEVAGTAGAAA